MKEHNGPQGTHAMPTQPGTLGLSSAFNDQAPQSSAIFPAVQQQYRTPAEILGQAVDPTGSASLTNIDVDASIRESIRVLETWQGPNSGGF